MNLATIEAKLFEIADAARTREDEATASALLALIPRLSEWQEVQRADQYRRQMDLFQKWNDFMNESMQDVFRRSKDDTTAALAKFARRIATDKRWRGTYADLVSLSNEA